MTAKLHVLKGEGRGVVHSCGECRHLLVGKGELSGPMFWKCGVFAGRYVSSVRALCGTACPGYEPRPCLAPRPPGLVRRLLLRVWRWLW